jgi:flavocytochrome c
MANKYDEVFDVVVIGSGFAGLAAAIEAKAAGASTIILEKSKGRGGNSIISEGFIAAAGSVFQKKQSIMDSPEQMASDMKKAGLGLNHPDLVRIITENSSSAIDWTIEEIGVTYHDQVVQLGGHSRPRTLMVKSRSDVCCGVVLVRKMLSKALGMGIEIRTQSHVQTIVREAGGPITGVIVHEPKPSPQMKTSLVKTIGCRKGVVLASGGFASDIQFRTILNPLLDSSVETTNRRGATAELLTEAIRIGAMPIHLSAIQLGPWATPDERGVNVGSNFASMAVFPHGIVVDPRTGERLLNELGDRKVRADAMLAIGHICIGFVDAKGISFVEHFLPRCISNGVVKPFDSLAKLAHHYKIPANKLMETVTTFNESLKKGKDVEFGRPIRGNETILELPPFYAIQLWPKIHYTSGGVQIDTHARVIGLDQQPIEGFFAAGEITGGVHGACRLGSCAISDCLVFGRIAGQQAALRLETKSLEP